MKASVIVATKNRPEQLTRCLEALSHQDHDDFEVIVIDNNGSRDIEPIVRAHDGRMRLLRQTRPGPAAARNAGVRIADGAVVAFTDDDCLPEPAWLSALVKQLKTVDTALVGGDTSNHLQSNIYSEASQTLVSFLYAYFGAELGSMPYFTSNNMACRRDLFMAMDGFDETFPIAAAEDRDFGHRWRENGHPLVFAPAARVRHAHHLTLAKFWRQHRNYGRGARHLHQVLKERQVELPGFEGSGFYTQLLTYPIRMRCRRPQSQSLLLALSQFATAFGYYTASDHTPALAAEPSCDTDFVGQHGSPEKPSQSTD